MMTDSIQAAVEQVLAQIPGDIILGLPLGVGKPNTFVNALYQRIKATPERKLRIITALSLERPSGKSTLEQNFLGPMVERIFGDYPDLDYVKDLRGAGLPPNIDVSEVFMKTGDYLGNASAQQRYISCNYTHIARDMQAQGMNVMAQAVGAQQTPAGLRLSLSSNPDVVLEVVEKFRASKQKILAIGVINQQMPFMPNTADVAPEFFDLVVTDPKGTHAVFGPPNGKVSLTDYAIGLHASSLVTDGGTLQIGIGSLGDAIAQALIVRDKHNAQYQRVLESLCPDGLGGRDLGRFDQGLYGCSEMFVNGFLKLIEAGIVRREVYGDTVLQQLINQGAIADGTVTPQTLQALRDAGRIQSPLTAANLAFLQHYGVLQADVRLEGDQLRLDGHKASADLRDDKAFSSVCEHMLGVRLLNGIFMTGGFFLGPRDFYERLRSMPRQELDKIDMTRIDFINQLYGQEELKRAQRREARFMNTTMIVTVLGAAASDALESGQVVSGVGGQYNFVAMSHALPDARLIMMLRSTHDTKAHGLTSSIVWNYGHVTIPRHLRDIVITEYGIAELRGQPDEEVIKRLVAVADSRFQDELVRQAKAHGKLEAHYEIPERYRANTPKALQAKLAPWAKAGLLPDFPFGTDLTPEELHLAVALKRLKQVTAHPSDLVRFALKSALSKKEMPLAYQERLGLVHVSTWKDSMVRKLIANNL